jgi:hypothetical protein
MLVGSRWFSFDIYNSLIRGKNVNLNVLIYVKTRKSLQAFHVTK